MQCEISSRLAYLQEQEYDPAKRLKNAELNHKSEHQNVNQ